MCSNLYKLHVIIYFLWLSLSTSSYAVLFTAISELEYLLCSHKRVIDGLKYYVSIQEKNLGLLKGYLDIFTAEHKKAMEDTSSYLHNPVNNFILIKRLMSDLEYLSSIIHKTGAGSILSKDNYFVYPVEADIVGAALGIVRLQKTYHLDINDLADGNLNNITFVSPMTASDCYELSQALMIKGQNFEYGREWMLKARQKYNEENVSYPFTKADILKHISIANIMLGDIPPHSTQQLIESKNYSENEEINKSIAEEVLKLYNKKLQQVNTRKENEKELATYQALCRGELVVPPQISNRFTCRYLNENHPYLKIAPFKIEMIYLDPDLVLFHEVMSESEVEAIKKQSRPMLVRAFINDPKTGYLTVTQKRVGKVAWLSDIKSDVITRITRRVSYMTGLNMELTDKSQIVNYGIGGQYEPHYDFATKKENLNFASANRIATVLFYLTDVAQGGATVFIDLGVRLLPRKGTAVFWYNLHPSGQCNLAMKHASCPVIQGDKWVCSKFIHQEPQQFLKPCNLEFEDEGFIRKIPHPVPKNHSN